MSKEGERVNAHRKAYFDRINLVVDKGGRALFRVLAMREGMDTSSLIRRSVLARAGLSVMPFDMEGLADINTQDDAAAVVQRLQQEEDTNPGIKKMVEVAGPEANNKTFEVTIDPDMEMILKGTIYKLDLARSRRIDSGAPTTQMVITGEELRTLRRILANIKEV